MNAAGLGAARCELEVSEASTRLARGFAKGVSGDAAAANDSDDD